MRITDITVDNFLSFDHFEWKGIDPRLNLIIGPNGAGKTNLFHTLRNAVRAIGFEAPYPEALPHRGSDDARSRVELGLQLDRTEQELLCAFFGAAFSDEQRLMQSETGPGGKVTPDNFPQIVAALQKALTPERFFRLAAGRLVVTCDGRDSWSAWYESVQEPYFLLPLTGSVPSAGNNTSVIYGSNKSLSSRHNVRLLEGLAFKSGGR